MSRHAFLALGLVLLAAPGLALAPRAALAAQSFDTCDGFIDSLPTVVASPGTWCLASDLTTSVSSGVAITINSADVVIDCNDHRIDGLGGGDATLAYGIYANNRANTMVRRCNVRGFYYGVVLANGSGHVAEDNRFDNNTYVALRVDGARSVVRRNRIADTGGSTAIATAFGVIANGSVDVIDNSIGSVFARSGGNGSAYGIHTGGNLAGSINRNRVRDVLKDGTGAAFGIYNATSDRVVMRGNDLLGAGGAGGLGLRCHNANGSARDNLILGFAAGISGCSNDGGNVNAP